MSLGLASMLLAGATDASVADALNGMMTTFSTVCLAPADLAGQHAAASSLPGVTKEVVSGFKDRKPVIPGARYKLPGMEMSVFGYRGAGLCAVARDFEPSFELSQYLAAIEARFGKRPHKKVVKPDYYRGVWADGSRQFDIEWYAKELKTTVLLSVRKRDGYSR
jgi:hypothetical protein